MNKSQIFQFIRFLKKRNYKVYGPVYMPDDGRVILEELHEPARDFDWTGRVPYFSFKDLIFPARHKLFQYRGAELQESAGQYPEQAVMMVSFVDLRALALYDKIFEKDVFYQSLRPKFLIVGTNLFDDRYENNHWGLKYSRDFLTHAPFDVFLEVASQDKKDVIFNVLTGSEKGKEILAAAKVKPEYHINYAGPRLRGEYREKMMKFQERMEKHYDPAIWNWLGSRCIECGQCTLVCPTCFCFDINDQPTGKNEGIRERLWTTCFYANFSEVGAPPKPTGQPSEGFEFLNTTAKKIHFWYYHKFGRIPKQYNIEGCVGCGRCTRACPVYINLPEDMKLVEGCQESAAIMAQKPASITKLPIKNPK